MTSNPWKNSKKRTIISKALLILSKKNVIAQELKMLLDGKKHLKYTAKFKTEAEKPCRESGKSVAESARDIGIAKSALNAWIKQAEIDAGGGTDGALTRHERKELIRLRRENHQVKDEPNRFWVSDITFIRPCADSLPAGPSFALFRFCSQFFTVL